jgi:adenine-specific DNA methylase
MGNKTKLLPQLNEVFNYLLADGDTICDLMAGTNSIGYERMPHNKIISNDVQFYSFIIAEVLLKNDEYIKSNIILRNYINRAYAQKTYFADIYADMYFSKEQCVEIDKIRSFIETLNGRTKNISLVALMHAMCKAQSTSGHFAQYLPKDNKRVIPLRKMSIESIYCKKLIEFDNIINAKYKNRNYNLAVDNLLPKLKSNKISCYYLDPPYTNDQYSRFYHLLDTACKYDNPKLDNTKALYRNDRFKSAFCYKSKAANEFEKIISFCKEQRAHLVISYSNMGVIPVSLLVELCGKYYRNKNVELVEINYNHSSQGKGVRKIKEIIVVCRK